MSDTVKKPFIVKERIALAEDINYRGYILNVHNGYQPGDQQTYTVQWDKSGAFLYLRETLITEKEADEIQSKIDAEKSEEQAKLIKTGITGAIAAKFRSMEDKLTEQSIVDSKELK